MNNYCTVPDSAAGTRVDTFLAQTFSVSRASIQRLLEQGRIEVNNLPVKARFQLKGGEIIAINWLAEELESRPEAPALAIIYEDEAFLAINKPAGSIVHPNQTEAEDSIIQRLLATHGEIAQALYDPNSPVSKLRPGVVHRLDRDTTGILLIAKTTSALHNLSAQFKDHQIKKTYLTFLAGTFKEPQLLKTNFGRKRSKPGQMQVRPVDEEGREAITSFIPVQTYTSPSSLQTLTLVECHITTGRTHQIRVHAKFIGHPVLGDQLYNNRFTQALSKELGATRQLLHAYRLVLNHPITNETLTLQAPLPLDMFQLLTKLQPADSV